MNIVSPRAKTAHELEVFLSGVPKHAIIDFLLDSSLQEQVLAVYRQDFDAACDDIGTRIHGLRRAELCSVLARVEDVSNAELTRLKEEWLFRGMKSLYLLRLNVDDMKWARLTSLSAEANVASAAIERLEAHSVPHNITFDYRESVNVAGIAVIELGYRYTVDVVLVDPQDEESKPHQDLRRGFVWLCPEQGWAAICARDSLLRDVLSIAMEKKLKVHLSNVYFTKDVIRICEPLAAARRLAFIDPATQVTRRYSGRLLGDDRAAQREIQKRAKRDGAPNSGYQVYLSDGTSMVLGYSNNQGKSFISRELSVTQLREWGVTKITSIMTAVRERMSSDAAFASGLLLPSLTDFPKAARPVLTALARTLSTCLVDRVQEADLPCRPLEIAKALGTRAQVLPYVVSESGEYVDLMCRACLTESITISGDRGKLHCRTCKQDKTKNQVCTIDGTRATFGSLDDNVLLLFTSDVIDGLYRASEELIGKPHLRSQGTVCVIGRQLTLAPAASDVVVELDELSEFSGLLEADLPRRSSAAILTALASFKEKCKYMSSDNCSTCVDERKHPKCYLRLFGLVDPSFIPRPHQGHEFGDYRRRVTIGANRDRTLAVVVKSASTGKAVHAAEISSSSRSGREILEQVHRYARSAAIDIIGIAVPNELHPELRAMLVDIASLHEKQLVFFGAVELSRLVYSALVRRNCTLEDI